MRRIISFLKRHTLWVGFLAVLVPLAVMLSLQYVWLASLERTSAIAHKASLNSFLEAVGNEVKYFYSSRAEGSLNLPASQFTEGYLQEVAHFWGKKPVKGAKRLFVMDYTREVYGNLLVFNPKRKKLETPPSSDEAMAILSACTPWQILSIRGGLSEDTVGLRVDERDPERRMILNPITDDRSRIVGVVGMIVDEKFFRRDLLPSIVEEAFPGFFPDDTREDLMFSALSGDGHLVIGSSGHEGEGETVSRQLPFIFADWTLRLHSHGATPDQWARAGFVFNMTLSVLLAVVLLGGVVLALRAANRAWRLSEMKADFVSNVSHELRTPLASIRVFAEFLRIGRAKTPEKACEYGEIIEAESRRLSRLIDNILDFSKIESGRKTYDFVHADVAEVVAAVLKTFEIRMRNSGYHVALHRPDVALPPVELDPDAISRAINNLLDNAVKYSNSAKQIDVHVTLDDEAVVIAVQDHGIGIARSEQRKIFDRFHRVGTGLVHDVKGSGLGLSIVHHIVKAHRGGVSVESEPGRGTTISIRLPVVSTSVPGWELGAEGTAAS